MTDSNQNIISVNNEISIQDFSQSNLPDFVVSGSFSGDSSTILSYRKETNSNFENHENYSRSISKPCIQRNIIDLQFHISFEKYTQFLRNHYLDLCKKGKVQEIGNFLDNNSQFDPHFDNEIAFTKACMENTCNVVEYLYYRTSPNITENHSEAFRYACLSNQIENAYFLQSICPSYDFRIRFRDSNDKLRTPISETYRDYVIDHNTITFGRSKTEVMDN